MTDSRLRELERAASVGTAADEARLLTERLRAGTLAHKWVELAAYLGHAPARLALGVDELHNLKGVPRGCGGHGRVEGSDEGALGSNPCSTCNSSGVVGACHTASDGPHAPEHVPGRLCTDGTFVEFYEGLMNLAGLNVAVRAALAAARAVHGSEASFFSGQIAITYVADWLDPPADGVPPPTGVAVQNVCIQVGAGHRWITSIGQAIGALVTPMIAAYNARRLEHDIARHYLVEAFEDAAYRLQPGVGHSGNEARMWVGEQRVVEAVRKALVPWALA